MRDIGIIGTPKGWIMLVRGRCGIQTKKGQVLARELSDSKVIDIIDKIIDYYKDKNKTNEWPVL